MAPAPPEPTPSSPSARRTNLAMHHKYRNSRRRTIWMPLLITTLGIAAILAVVQFGRRTHQQTRATAIGDPSESQPSTKQEGRFDGSDASRPAATAPIKQNHPSGPPTAPPKTGSDASDIQEKSIPDDTRPTEKTNEPTVDLVRARRLQFHSLLRDARVDLENKRFREANDRLTKASSISVNETEVAKLERLRLLSDYVEEFWKAFDESLADLEGVELVLDGELALVVAVNPNEIVLRRLGENQRQAIDQLPTEITLAIADRRFNQEAASSLVFKGAFMAVEPRLGREKARQLWRSAVAAGVDIGDLEQVLDDTYEHTLDQDGR